MNKLIKNKYEVSTFLLSLQINYQSYLFNPIQSMNKSQANDNVSNIYTGSPTSSNQNQLSIQIISLKSKLSGLQQENTKLNSDLTDMKIKYSELENQKKQYQLDYDSIEKQNLENQEELEQTKEHLNTIIQKLGMAEKLKSELLKQLDEITAKNVDISVKLNDLQENFDEKLQIACQKIIQEAQQQEFQYQQQIQTLNEQLQDKNEELQKVKKQLNELQAAQIDYEKLIESAAAVQSEDKRVNWKQMQEMIANLVQVCNEQDLELRKLHLKSTNLQNAMQILKVDYEALQNERGIGMRETQQALAQVQASRAVKMGNSIASQ